MKKVVFVMLVCFPFIPIFAQRLIVKPSSQSGPQNPSSSKGPEKRFALKTGLSSFLHGQFSVSGEYVLNNSFSAELEFGILSRNYLGTIINNFSESHSLLNPPFPYELLECNICTEEKTTLGFSYAAHFRYFWDYAAFEDVGYLGLLISRRNYRGEYSVEESLLNAAPGSGLQVLGFDKKREENYTDIAFSLGHQYDYSSIVFIDYNILLGYRLVESKGFVNPYDYTLTDNLYKFGRAYRENIMFQIQVKLGFVLF